MVIGQFEPGIGRQGERKVGGGASAVAQLVAREAAVEHGVGVVRLHFQGRGEQPLGLLVIPPVHEHGGEVVVGGQVSLVGLEGLAVIQAGFLPVALALEEHAAGGEGFGEVLLEQQRLVVIFEGGRFAPGGQQRVGPLEVELRRAVAAAQGRHRGEQEQCFLHVFLVSDRSLMPQASSSAPTVMALSAALKTAGKKEKSRKSTTKP